MVAAIPLAIMTGISVVDIPLVPLILATFSLSVLLGWVSLGLLVGRFLPFRIARESNTLCALSGLTILKFVGAVPFLWLLLISVPGLMGVGAVYLSKFGSDGSESDVHPLQRQSS